MVTCQSTQNTCRASLSLQNALSVWLHNHADLTVVQKTIINTKWTFPQHSRLIEMHLEEQEGAMHAAHLLLCVSADIWVLSSVRWRGWSIRWWWPISARTLRAISIEASRRTVRSWRRSDLVHVSPGTNVPWSSEINELCCNSHSTQLPLKQHLSKRNCKNVNLISSLSLGSVRFYRAHQYCIYLIKNREYYYNLK